MTENNEISAVIFDLGRVLVDIDLSVFTMQLFSDITDADPEKIVPAIMSDPLMLEFNKGKIIPQQFHRQLTNRYNLNVSYPDFEKLWCSIFKPMPGAKELVESLYKKITIGLLSDTDPVHWSFLARTYPWLQLIENPTLSFQVEAMKPSSELYITAAKNVNTPPQNCLYIDDMQQNVEGAISTGMHAIKFESTETLIQHLKSINIPL